MAAGTAGRARRTSRPARRGRYPRARALPRALLPGEVRWPAIRHRGDALTEVVRAPQHLLGLVLTRGRVADLLREPPAHGLADLEHRERSRGCDFCSELLRGA